MKHNSKMPKIFCLLLLFCLLLSSCTAIPEDSTESTTGGGVNDTPPTVQDFINPDTPVPYSVPTGHELTSFDVYDPTLTAVLNSADGYYHVETVDGPVLLLKLTEQAPYLGKALSELASGNDLLVDVYDEGGKLIGKDRYNALLTQYAAMADTATGTYPIDKYLMKFLTESGKALGWYDSQSEGYLFADGDQNGRTLTENAHLFATCYNTRGYKVGEKCYAIDVPVMGTDTTAYAEIFNLSQNAGKLTLINFWYTDCNPCKKEMPEFDRLANDYADSLTVLALHADTDTSVDGKYEIALINESLSFIDEHLDSNEKYWFEYNIVFGFDKDNLYYTLLGGDSSYPYTLLIDQNGVVASIYTGETTYETLKSDIDRILGTE